MKSLLRALSAVHALTAVLFALAALVLLGIACRLGFMALGVDLDRTAAQHIIEAMGVLAAAVVALQIAQTILEEEVVRDAHVSGPTRVRRFLSRFLVVIVVALAIESLVATFRSAHADEAGLLRAAALVASVGLLLVGWGVFIRMNRAAEELEPEAMEDAKSEDRKLA
ncbi:hypothetical protein [Roseateles sp. BYS96W]|uniref:Uncharacterized protein n=1 Tax=Pelomonas nitida TaxID=3299027 RepID=A0ABW7GAP5_9BURK